MDEIENLEQDFNDKLFLDNQEHLNDKLRRINWPEIPCFNIESE